MIDKLEKFDGCDNVDARYYHIAKNSTQCSHYSTNVLPIFQATNHVRFICSQERRTEDDVAREVVPNLRVTYPPVHVIHRHLGWLCGARTDLTGRGFF